MCVWVCGFLEFLLSTKIAAAVASSYILCLSNKKRICSLPLLIVWSTTYLKNSLMLMGSHLSKGKSDLKQNAKQLVTPFLVQFFILFLKISQIILYQIKNYHLKVSRVQNWPYHVKEKMYQ